jgi:uncharacterized protein YjbI with pentapeptide repeats
MRVFNKATGELLFEGADLAGIDLSDANLDYSA